MNLVECLGNWQHAATGEIICDGTLQIVSSVPSSLPELTFLEANLIVAAYAGLLAIVLGIKLAGRVILPPSSEG